MRYPWSKAKVKPPQTPACFKYKFESGEACVTEYYQHVTLHGRYEIARLLATHVVITPSGESLWFVDEACALDFIIKEIKDKDNE